MHIARVNKHGEYQLQAAFGGRYQAGGATTVMQRSTSWHRRIGLSAAIGIRNTGKQRDR